MLHLLPVVQQVLKTGTVPAQVATSTMYLTVLSSLGVAYHNVAVEYDCASQLKLALTWYAAAHAVTSRRFGVDSGVATGIRTHYDSAVQAVKRAALTRHSPSPPLDKVVSCLVLLLRAPLSTRSHLACPAPNAPLPGSAASTRGHAAPQPRLSCHNSRQGAGDHRASLRAWAVRAPRQSTPSRISWQARGSPITAAQSQSSRQQCALPSHATAAARRYATCPHRGVAETRPPKRL